MKKKSILLGGVCLLSITGSVAFFANKPMSAEEALLMRNVEAIARGEDEEKKLDIHSTVGYCYVFIQGKEYRGGGSPQCQAGNRMTVCPDCYIGNANDGKL